MEWFKDWFDSKYYHILYKNRNDQEAERFLENLCNLKYFKNQSKIIDIACGRGRHSIFLSKLGHNVTGIDLSKESIDFANKYKNEKLKFDIADMRECYHEKHFDIALNLFTSFAYFETQKENQESINAMKDNLKVNGLLIVDFLNINFVKKTLIEEEIKIIDNIEFKIKRNITNDYISKQINFKNNDKSYHYIEKVKTYELEDFCQMLSNANCTIIDVFGGYDLAKFNENKSKRLIIIAKRWR
tara:strand:+ start:1404 stop:2132 length:729 start_codon:yes stop_codon:yes gene_type:complete